MTIALTEEEKQQAIDAFHSCNKNKQAAARLLDMPISTYKSRLDRAMRHPSATQEHITPHVPEGQTLRGISTLYDADGNVSQQWIKTHTDLDRQLAILKEAAEALKDDVPREKPVDFTAQCNADLLSQYTITDYHLGMMSKHAEVGEEWNSELAVDFLVKWIANLMQSAPNSKTAILCQLGDFMHFDSMDAVTPTSKHLMDTDTRYSLMVNMAVKVLRRVINMLLEKHEHVHVIMAEGNHDMASSIWLRALFADKYADEPRVTVDNSHLPYYAFEHGQTSLFYHHGHKNKMGQVSKTFAGMYREMFGRTTFSYVHMGHYHHVDQKEDSLMLVEQHPTMAAKDAYAARGGWLSKRGASVITYHKIHGEIARATTRPEMVQ